MTGGDPLWRPSRPCNSIEGECCTRAICSAIEGTITAIVAISAALHSGHGGIALESQRARTELGAQSVSVIEAGATLMSRPIWRQHHNRYDRFSEVPASTLQTHVSSSMGAALIFETLKEGCTLSGRRVCELSVFSGSYFIVDAR